mgnify:CR=1 FL=1
MTIELSSDIEAQLQKVLKSGGFESAEQFIRFSLNNYEAEDALYRDEASVEWLRAEVQKGIDSGEAETHDIEEIIAEAKRREQNQASTH